MIVVIPIAPKTRVLYGAAIVMKTEGKRYLQRSASFNANLFPSQVRPVRHADQPSLHTAYFDEAKHARTKTH